jgi:hypothetical protein
MFNHLIYKAMKTTITKSLFHPMSAWSCQKEKEMALMPYPMMKALLMLFIVFPLFLNGQVFNSLEGNLSVQVNGDIVTLSQSLAERNCGADYDMKVFLKGDTLYWYQDDHGSSAYCSCNFNLSVTVGPMPSGHYTAMVFFTECPDCPSPGPDTVYVGSIEFEIVTPNSNSSFNVISQYQSDCHPYTSTKDDKVSKLPFSIFPSPVQNILHFVTTDSDEKAMSIYDMQNRRMFECKFDNGMVDLDVTSYKSGMYILVYSNRSTTYHFNFIKE